MGNALRRVVTTASAFYLLGYSPSDTQMDGKFRQIKVHVKKSGVQVRSRNGYWAPRSADIDRARAIAAAAALPSTVALAFKELTPNNSRRPVDFWVGLSPADEGGCSVNVAWSPRPGGESRSAAASVSVIASRDQAKVFDGAVKEGGIAFPVPPGNVDLEFTIRDRAGDVIDREQRTLTVPDTDKTTLALSTPVLSRARNTTEFRSLTETPLAFAGRDFLRTDRVLLRVTPYGSASMDADVSAQLLGPRGDTLVELPIHSTAAGDYQLDLPLTSLASGEFLIAIVARTATERVETLVPLRIGR
jgi:hypothetical protein